MATPGSKTAVAPQYTPNPLPKLIMGQASDLVGLDDMARDSAIRERTRVSRTKRNWECLVCGKQDGQCIRWPDPDHDTVTHVWCIRGDNFPGAIDLTGWGFRGGAWYIRLDDDGNVISPPRTLTHATRDYPVTDAKTVDRVLAATARFFGLSAAHKAKLKARGYDPAECGPNGRYLFASLPADIGKRMEVSLSLLAQFARAEDLLGTYGFSQDRRRGDGIITFLPLVEGTALLEFVIDADGNLTGFQYAPDKPKHDEKGKPKKRLTPARMTLTGRYHVAKPNVDSDQEIWHTEGIHKANLTAVAKQAPATAIMGAGNYGNTFLAAQALDPKKRRRQILAFDSDQWGEKGAEGKAARKLLDQGYRVMLARWDAAHKGPDDALAAGAPITLHEALDERSKPRRDERIAHAYPWQRRSETPTERHEHLQLAANESIISLVRAHLDANERERVLVIAAPPGVGKSNAVAQLGAPNTAYPKGEYNIAWIAERHEMAASVPALGRYRQIQRPSWENCYTPDLHDELARKGYNTGRLHSLHQCDYHLQFQREGSAFYQLAHAQTHYPAQHQVISIDEFDVGKWLTERAFMTSHLSTAAASFEPGSTADLFLRALQATITDTMQAYQQGKGTGTTNYTAPHGRSVFEVLNARCGGYLAAWLGALGQTREATELRPDAGITPDETDALEFAERLKPVILPHIWHAFARELVAWQRGGEWNSLLRIGPATVAGEWALHITEPRTFGREIGKALPPRIVLDATADATIHAKLLGAPVEIARVEIEPPPHMRHIAVRSRTNKGALKRWGKMALTRGTNQARDLARTAAELRYLLADLDHDGTRRSSGHVGLITYQGCEQELAEALGIPYSDPTQPDSGSTGHFWGMRGSNRLEHCEILLIVGTPAPNPADVQRWAHAIYRDDPVPLDETAEIAGDGWRYRDERLQTFAEYLSRAELTQCAHRNRPLRYDGRIIVTLCAAEVDFLPVTTTITSLPHLTSEGEQRVTAGLAKVSQRLAEAATAILARGAHLSANALVAEAHVSKRDACDWLRGHKEDLSM